MSEDFNIKVRIKNDLRRGLIFGIKARLPIGIILSFAGYRHEVMPLLQKLSHGTRAYIVNADGLPGFLIENSLIEILQDADKCGKLIEERKQ